MGGLLAGCGTQATTDASNSPVASTHTATATSTRTVVPTRDENPLRPDAPMLGAASLADKSQYSHNPGQLVVTNVRLGAHDGYDRLVVDFTGQGEPGWNTQFTTQPTQLASGYPISFQGAEALDVLISSTTYPTVINAPGFNPQTVSSADTKVISEVSFVGTFEDQSQVVVGLKKKVPYSINVLHEPTRLVIDFQTS